MIELKRPLPKEAFATADAFEKKEAVTAQSMQVMHNAHQQAFSQLPDRESRNEATRLDLIAHEIRNAYINYRFGQLSEPIYRNMRRGAIQKGLEKPGKTEAIVDSVIETVLYRELNMTVAGIKPPIKPSAISRNKTEFERNVRNLYTNALRRVPEIVPDVPHDGRDISVRELVVEAVHNYVNYRTGGKLDKKTVEDSFHTACSRAGGPDTPAGQKVIAGILHVVDSSIQSIQDFYHPPQGPGQVV